MATDGWYPPAIDNPAASSAPAHSGPVEVGALHKTISPPGSFRPSSSSYFGHQSYPHFTTDVQGGVFKCWQHISIRKAAKALKNESGGVVTNTEGVIQIEIVGYANNTMALHSDPELSRLHYEGLAKLMRWIESQTAIPRRTGVTFYSYPPPNGVRLDGNEPWRLSDAAWRGYKGWLGHQHVPENYHGDPGVIDIKALLGTESAPAPIFNKEIDMFIVDDPSIAEPEKNRQWVCGASTKRRAKDWDEILAMRDMGTYHWEEKPETVVKRTALLAARVDVTV